MTYKEFLERKIDIAPLSGIEIDPAEVNPVLKDHQRVSVLWALRGGRRSIFARFGLGKTVMQLEWLNKRRAEGLTTPKQIRVLERYGFQSVGTWSFDAAKHMIDRIAAGGWRGVPKGVNPKTYTPAQEPPTSDIDFGW